MNLTRRQALQAAAILSASGTARAEETKRRPTKFIQLIPRGGMDALLTTDPKAQAEVDARIRIPYAQKDLITPSSDIAYGPLFRHFGNLPGRMAVCNGVACETVSHETGIQQLLQMRRSVPRHSRSLVGALGQALGGKAVLGEIRFTSGKFAEQHTSQALELNYTAVDPVAFFHKLSTFLGSGESRKEAAAALAKSCSSGQSGRNLCTLLDRGPLPPLRPGRVPFPEIGVTGAVKEQMTRSLKEFVGLVDCCVYALEHDLTSSVALMHDAYNWDSHALNGENQDRSMLIFALGLNYLVSLLDERKGTSGRPLRDEVGILISSELGRYPILNSQQGKDHFPEMPVMLLGPGVRAGKFGATDQLMIAKPIGDDGRASPSGFLPTIDDLGATVLKWFGFDKPQQMGYPGRPLDFLLA